MTQVPDGAAVAGVELRFTALPVHVRTARLLSAAMGRRSGLDDGLLDEVKLAVGEACSRAVSVHRTHAPDALVLVRFGDTGGRFSVEVVDVGPPGEQVPRESAGSRKSADELLDAEQAGAPDAEPGSTLPPGLGLALIEGLVDDVAIAPLPGGAGTSVTMGWPLRAALPHQLLTD